MFYYVDLALENEKQVEQIITCLKCMYFLETYQIFIWIGSKIGLERNTPRCS